MRTCRWRILAAVLVFVVGLAVLGSWNRRRDNARCALDGAAIDLLYRVKIEDRQGRIHSFCCIRCAELWLDARRDRPRAVLVTDEATGEEYETTEVIFVRSSVVTQAATGNRVHAFRNRRDAEKHAAGAGGRILEGADRPFGR
jgi:hypothetical protein